MGDKPAILISIEGLEVHHRPGRKTIKAVDGVSLEIRKGEVLGLVGESGCGKSTLGKAILRLIEPSRGRVVYNGVDLAHLSPSELRKRRRHLQIIFQDPYSSLNPKMTVEQIVGEPIHTFGLAKRIEIQRRVGELMESVGLSRNLTKRYPHEFSGGQRQRIGIARAMAVDPDFIVADEPLSALDVSIQAQIMNLLKRLQVDKGLTYLFISHDLRAVRHLAERIAVMYLGRIVEVGPGHDVYDRPLMPYTRALLSSLPVPDPSVEAQRGRKILKGDVPSSTDPPSGCRFRTRCPHAIDECGIKIPQLSEIKPDHQVACIRINAERPDIEANASAGLGAIG